jgi:hypothetical protein
MKKAESKKYTLYISILMLLLFQTQASAIAWKLNKSFWTEEDEKVYENFVASIGNSKHSNINKFIKDPQSNPLYGKEDNKFYLYTDCADLPYIIRAYVAYKLRLPFGYVSKITSKGGDQRYSRGNKPCEFKDQDYFSSPQKLFSQVTLINSGFFRMAADVEDSDHYPVKIQPESIKPGTIFYDPDGHVAIVYKVREDGRLKVIDGHPDQSISKPWFGKKFKRGTAKNGGGFKRWRPLRYTSNGQIRRASNHNIPDYSQTDQFQKSYSLKGRKNLSYYDYVRERLAKNKVNYDPVSDFTFMMTDLYEDICYRAVAVNIAINKGISKKPHPGSLPWNIYGTDGIWEEFSTPSRDARLKVAFKDFYDRTCDMVLALHAINPGAARALAEKLLAKYIMLSPKFTVEYKDSQGNHRVLTFDDVANRLFRLSFDPYHSIEFRWGANPEELALSLDSQKKRRFYDLEHSLRNQLERRYNCKTPLSMGPENPPEVRVKPWLTNYLAGRLIQDQKIAQTPSLLTESVNYDIVQIPQTKPSLIQKQKSKNLDTDVTAQNLKSEKAEIKKIEIDQTAEKIPVTKKKKTTEPQHFLHQIDTLVDEFASMIVSEVQDHKKVITFPEN